MPTALIIFGYRFFFYSNEGKEPPYIHVEKGENEIKFWLTPVELCKSYGFSAKQVNEIRNIIIEHEEELLKAWYEHFS